MMMRFCNPICCMMQPLYPLSPTPTPSSSRHTWFNRAEFQQPAGRPQNCYQWYALFTIHGAVCSGCWLLRSI